MGWSRESTDWYVYAPCFASSDCAGVFATVRNRSVTALWGTSASPSTVVPASDVRCFSRLLPPVQTARSLRPPRVITTIVSVDSNGFPICLQESFWPRHTTLISARMQLTAFFSKTNIDFSQEVFPPIQDGRLRSMAAENMDRQTFVKEIEAYNQPMLGALESPIGLRPVSS